MTLRVSWTEGGVEFGLRFDCVVNETHETTATITEHAVESGAPISDHKRANPRKIRFEGVFSNTPIGDPPETGTGLDLVKAETRKSEKANAVVRVFTGPFDRIVDGFAVLSRLVTEAIPVTISTRLIAYDAVQLTSVTVPRKAEDGSSITATVEATEVRIADSLRVDVPVPREPRGTRGRDEGDTATEEITGSSVARNILNSDAGQAVQRFFGS